MVALPPITALTRCSHRTISITSRPVASRLRRTLPPSSNPPSPTAHLFIFLRHLHESTGADHLKKAQKLEESLTPGLGESNRNVSPERIAEELQRLLLPNTLVMPPFSKRPSLFTQTSARLKMEWIRIKIKWRDVATRFFIARWYKDAFRFPSLVSAAESLHRNMYTAYASGDLDALADICGRDLLFHFRGRIEDRPSNIQFSWKFIKYNSPSRVVSHKVMVLPLNVHPYEQPSFDKDTPEDIMRQAIVRIDSSQVLTKGVSGKVVKGTGEVERKVEYIVIGMRRKDGEVLDEWRVWGTVEETTYDEMMSFSRPPKGSVQLK